MEKSHTTLCIIPARGGSKRIPRKNLAVIGGKPLISYTIKAALDSRILDRICVSTEDIEIAETAQTEGAEVPFMRPGELAEDNIPGIHAVIYTIRLLEERENYRPDYILVLPPTSPFRTSQDVVNTVKLALGKKADSVIGISPSIQHPYWMKTVTDEGRLEPFIELDRHYQAQQLPSVYAVNGSIYLVRREMLLEHQTYYYDNTYAYIMPIERSLDIDSPWDLYLADLIIKDRQGKEAP